MNIINTYDRSGVDLKLYNKLIKEVNLIVGKSQKKEVISKEGSFSALFDFSSFSKRYEHPVLVSSTDGVGTKLLIAQEVNEHYNVGIDLVAMCVNDLLAQGATPLFFLDYFATGNLSKNALMSVINGIVKGCKHANISLIGGETAEMPGMYNNNKYDLAGFVVGVVDKSNILPKYNIMIEGDYLVGLKSNGIHSNGFSLVRHIFKSLGISYNDLSPWDNKTWSEILLEPTRIYVDSVLPIIQDVKGVIHITGGSLMDNIPRMLPKHLFAEIDVNSWEWQDIFLWLITEGAIDKTEMLRTFNCGIGMVLIISPKKVQIIKKYFQEHGEKVEIIGRLRKKI